MACNYRGDYDLSRHSQVSGTDFTVLDGGAKVLPHVFELSLGVDRSVYSIIELSMKTDGDKKLMAVKPYLAPISVCVFPLVNKDGLDDEAAKLYDSLRENLDAYYDDSGSIGRRYARADEIGVPYCVTLDYDTMKDGTVTLRDRDTRAQERVKADELAARVAARVSFPPL